MDIIGYREVRKKIIDKLIAQATLRSLDAKFLMSHWCETALDEQIRQSFHLLSSACFLHTHLMNDEENIDEEHDEQQNSSGEVFFILFF